MKKFKNFRKKLKTRKILMSVGLSWKLVFGQAGVGYAQPYIFNYKSRVVQEKVILNQPHEALKSTLEIHCGDLGKLSSPGSRAKADARRNAQAGKYSSKSSVIPGANAFVPQTPWKSFRIWQGGWTTKSHSHRIDTKCWVREKRSIIQLYRYYA